MNILAIVFLASLVASERPADRRTFRSRFNAEDFVYDVYAAPSSVGGMAGTVKPVDVETMPSLDGEGVSYSVFQIEPCGINLPHVHPRASEILYVINGSDLRVSFVEENGGRTITNDIREGMVTMFPRGLIHYQQNLGCETANYISGLDHEDPGVVTISTRFFAFPPEAIASALDTTDAETEYLTAGIPLNPAMGREECMQRCNPSKAGYRQSLRQKASEESAARTLFGQPAKHHKRK